MDQINKDSDNPRRLPQLPNSVNPPLNRSLLITILVALVILAAIWIWRSIQVSNLKKKAVADRASLSSQARQHVRETHEAHFRMLAKPLVWAIRSEMMQGNTSQVNLYINDLVKEKNIQRIVIANGEGLIVSSTNKKDEGKQFSSIGKPAYLTSDTTVVESTNDSSLVMSSPIMGFNNRLGTVMIMYSVKYTSFR